MEERRNFQKIYYRLKDPNPLFTKWVEEWKHEAEKKNSRSKNILSEALDSLKKFPLPLESGKDCLILRGFGKTLCSMLDDKLKEYKSSHASPVCDVQKSESKFVNGTNFSKTSDIIDSSFVAHTCNDSPVTNVENQLNKYEKLHISPVSSLQVIDVDTIDEPVEINNRLSTNIENILQKYQNFHTSPKSRLQINTSDSDPKLFENISFTKEEDNFEKIQNLYTSPKSILKKDTSHTRTNLFADYNIPPILIDDEECYIDASPASEDLNFKNNFCIINPFRKISNVGIKDAQEPIVENNDIFYEKSLQPITTNVTKRIEPLKRVNSGTSKLYSPVYRSGSYAILIVLIKLHNENIISLSKDEIITKAQIYCDKSFTVSEKGCRYTAWNSMSTLTSKNLVSKTGKPAKYNLTEDGIIVATELLKKYVEKSPEKTSGLEVVIDNEENFNLHVLNKANKQATQNNKKTKQQTELDAAIFPPNSFETILLVDTQETSGIAKRAYDETIKVLTEINIKFEIRRLNVGDFAWICRDETNRELLLPYIVERKRMDDFGSSIRDGRFREQKFRLKQSGIQNLIYLIESYGRNEHTGLPITSLLQAASNTSIQDDFILKFTNTHKDSMMYLAVLTRMLKENISNKTLVSCPKKNLKKFCFHDDIIALMDFIEFQNSSKKTKKFTVNNMFIKHLMRIKGISMDKALAIVAMYPSPHDLYEAFNACPSGKGKDLLTNIHCETINRKIGPAMSETLFHLFTSDKYS